MKKAQLTGFLVAAMTGIIFLTSTPAQAAKPFDEGERVAVESLTGVAGAGLGMVAGGLIGAIVTPNTRSDMGKVGGIVLFGALGGAIGLGTGVYAAGNAFAGSNGKLSGLVAGELIGIGAAVGAGLTIGTVFKRPPTMLYIGTIAVLILGGAVVGYELTQTQSQPIATQHSPFTVAPQRTLGIQLPFVF
jgi:hypothetical protein